LILLQETHSSKECEAQWKKRMGGRDIINCPLKKGGIQIPRRHVVKSIEEIQDEFSLHDIWRIKNPNQQSFTWGHCSPFVFCRLDYWELVQYADDLTLFLSDLTSAQNLFKLLDHFGKLSGLKVNYTKTEAMWIGLCHDSPNRPLSLKWCKSL